MWQSKSNPVEAHERADAASSSSCKYIVGQLRARAPVTAWQQYLSHKSYDAYSCTTPTTLIIRCLSIHPIFRRLPVSRRSYADAHNTQTAAAAAASGMQSRRMAVSAAAAAGLEMRCALAPKKLCYCKWLPSVSKPRSNINILPHFPHQRRMQGVYGI